MDNEPTATQEDHEDEAAATVTLTEDQFERWQETMKELSEPSEQDVEEKVNEKAEKELEADTKERLDPINPNTEMGVAVGDDRSVDGDGWKMQMYRILDGVARRDYKQVQEARMKLAKAGHYGQRVKESLSRAASDPILTSGQASPFLPTAVMDRIEDLGKDYGVAMRDATTFTFDAGSVVIPNVSGRFDAFAVNEGASIKSRKANFGSTTLDPDKYGVIVPWTNETSEEVGPQVVDKIVDLAGEAFLEMQDKTVFTADGTATYHSLTGLLNDGSIGEYVMDGPGVDSAFGGLEFDDYSKLKEQVDPTARQRGTYYMHHDIGSITERIKDNDGQYIYGPQANLNELGIWSRPVGFTEALPGSGSSAADTSFVIYGDLSFVTIGIQRQLQSTLLTEATIEEVDNSAANIHLAAKDSQALRFTMRWDVVFGLTGAFAKLTTAGEGS